jgi:hypothetical protein
MRSATSISANAMRSFSLGVSRPVSDILQEYHGSYAGRAQKRDTNWRRRSRNRAFLGRIATARRGAQHLRFSLEELRIATFAPELRPVQLPSLAEAMRASGLTWPYGHWTELLPFVVWM